VVKQLDNYTVTYIQANFTAQCSIVITIPSESVFNFEHDFKVTPHLLDDKLGTKFWSCIRVKTLCIERERGRCEGLGISEGIILKRIRKKQSGSLQT
jgi:hypothetical protein